RRSRRPRPAADFRRPRVRGAADPASTGFDGVAVARKSMRPRPFHGSLFVQVFVGIGAGIALGCLAPDKAAAMRPIGDAFIKLIRMMIAPIVFATVVVGIAQMGAMKDVGRIGLRALLYFELVSTVALVIGLAVVTVLKPGSGLAIAAAGGDVDA